MVMQSIDAYFKSNIHKPFYVVVGDSEYKTILDQLTEAGGVDFIHVSDCCGQVDKKPNLDKLREILRMADIDCETNKIVLLGVGEYLALEGSKVAQQILEELITFNLGSAQAIFLLRGVAPQVKAMAKNDPRLLQRQIYIAEQTQSALSFMFSSIDLGMYPKNGFKEALKMAEAGMCENICVNSALVFPDSMCPVQIISNPYEALCKKIPGFGLPKQLGTNILWEELLKDVNQSGSLVNVFGKYNFELSLSDFYTRISGSEYFSWLYYLFLVQNVQDIKNEYIQYVVAGSNDLTDFKYMALNQISNIAHTDPQFVSLYLARKKIAQQYPESEIAVFVSNNRFNPEESVYKLTDNTLVEREEIIADIAQHGMPSNLEMIYPDLALYLKKYHFQGDSLNDLLTSYFDEYKRQKLMNVISEDFLQQVDQLAISRDYNRLRTRDELVSSIGADSTFLCWVDALGVEYLSYIVELAHRKGLAVSVNVGRCDLPTITPINKKFYELWPDLYKRKVEDLDDVKHHEKGGYKYGPSNLFSIHLAKELQIISAIIDEAATDLGLRQYDRYVIASDHGASRLAVLRKKEEKYTTDTQGEHSGRCCKLFSGYDLPFATEENGYVVLADYGRFSGSRAANVEVHGGASLEEVLVPVIVLSLRDTSIVIKMVESTVKADYKKGATITLFVNKTITHPLYVECNGNRYQATAIDENHYRVDLTDIKRACTVSAGIFLGEDLISHITIKAVGKSAAVDSDFDDLF